VETASSLSYKNGYYATGINEIIAKSQMAKSSPSNHFKSIEDLCVAQFQYKNSTFLKDFRSFLFGPKKCVRKLLQINTFYIKKNNRARQT